MRELEKLEKDNLEQLVERFNELDLEDMIDQKLKLAEEKQLIADQEQWDDSKCISDINNKTCFEETKRLKWRQQWSEDKMHEELLQKKKKRWIFIKRSTQVYSKNITQSSCWF